MYNMKNLLRNKIPLFVLVLVLFSSCNNFFSGKQRLEQLKANIDYQNAPYISATVSKLDPDDASAISGSELIKSQKVGYPFEIFYTPGSIYIFNYWQALNSNNEPFEDEEVFIEDKTAPTTIITINTTEKVLIQAVTSIKPTTAIKFVKSDSNNGFYNTSESVTLNLDVDYEFSFSVAEGYQFIKYQCSDDSVQIENPTLPNTTLKTVKGGESVITAVCAPRPKVVISNTLNLTETICKDTSIIINFDRALSAQNSLSDIKLLLSGNELVYGENEAFGTPYFYKNENGEVQYDQVIIPANKYHPFTIDKEKNIQVIIPETIFYIDSKTNEKIYLAESGNPYKWSYRVSNESNTKAKITVSYEEKYGSLLQGENGTYNIGDEVTFEFSESNGSKFLNWNVTMVPANIASVNKSGKKAVLKIQDSGTITIQAKAVTVPTYSITPAFIGNGYDYDTAIKISFNKIIPSEYCTFEYIKIREKDTKTAVDNYFTITSDVVDGKTTIILTPKYTIKNIFTAGTSNTTVEDLEIDFVEGIKDADDFALPVGEPFVHRIANRVEEVPPEIKDLQISKSNTFNPVITKKTYTNWEETDYANHHVGKVIYIKARVSDLGSGVANKLYVSECKKSTDGVVAENERIALKEATLISAVNNDKEKTLTFSYTLRSENDGILNLRFVAEDNAGNRSNVICENDVIKDTKIDFSDLWIFNFVTDPYNITPEDGTITEWNESLKTIYVYYDDAWLTGKIQCETDFSDPEMKIEVKAGTDKANLTPRDIISYSGYITFELADLSAEKETYISLTITDTVGNSGTYNASIPAAGHITAHTIDGDYYRFYMEKTQKNTDFPLIQKGFYVVNESVKPQGTAENILIEMNSGKNDPLMIAKTGDDVYYCVGQNGYITGENNQQTFYLYGLIGSEHNTKEAVAPRNEGYIPPAFEISRRTGELNSSKDTIVITWPENTVFEDNYEYNILWTDDSQGNVYANSNIEKVKTDSAGKPLSLSFTVPNKIVYIGLQAKDNHGWVYNYSSDPTDPNALGYNYNAPTEDITPPTVNEATMVGADCVCRIKLTDNKGLLTKTDGAEEYVEVEYWLVPYYDGVKNITEDEVSNYPHFKQGFIPANNSEYYIHFQHKDVAGKKQAIVAKFYDKANNYFFGYVSSFEVNSLMDVGKPVEFSIDSNSIARIKDTGLGKNPIRCISVLNGNGKNAFLNSLCKNTSGKYITEYLTFTDKDENGYYTDLSSQITELANDNFYMINILFDLNQSRYSVSVPQFFYKGTKPATLTKKMDAVSETSVVVNSNAPYMLFTLASAKNHGTDKAAWFLNGYKSNFLRSNNLDFYTIENSAIEEGDYYVICCVFADGSYQFSTPVQYK